MKNKNVSKAVSTENNLTVKHRIGYAAGDAGGVITLVLIMGYMNRFVTNVLGVPFVALSALLLIWNIWDMVNDPLVGTLMDKSFEKAKGDRDKFRPWILASIPVMVLGFIAFFTVPNMLSGFAAVASLFLLKILYEWGYTMMNIAMGSVLGAMALNDTERATLSSARGIGSSVGALVAGVIVPQLLASLGENPRGYMISAVTIALLGGFLVFIHYAWTEERNASARIVVDDENATEEEREENKVKFTDIINVFKQNRAFLALSLHSVIIVLGTTMYSQFNSYMYADVLGNIGLMTYTTIISQFLSIGLLVIAPSLAKRFGGTVNLIKSCLTVGAILLIALFGSMVAINIPPLVYLLVSAVGFGLVNMSVQLQWGLVSEAIDYNEYLTGKRTEGAIYGTFSLTRRVGQTVAQSLAVLIIGWIGYNPELTNQGLAQSAGTIFGITAMNLAIPAAAALISWSIFKFIWNIDDEMRAKIAQWKLDKARETEDEEVIESLEDEAVAASGSAILEEPLLK